MKEALKLVGATGLFCLVAGLLLALTNKVTEEPIREAKRQELIQGLNKVLPACDNDLLADKRTFTNENAEWTFYVGKSSGTIAGVAFESSSSKGYGGLITVLVGILPDGSINGIIITAPKETPGLGTKVTDTPFRSQFKGRKVSPSAWSVTTKDGGEIQGITGATISSRAVCEAVRNGLEAYNKYSADFQSPPAVAQPVEKEQP